MGKDGKEGVLMHAAWCRSLPMGALSNGQTVRGKCHQLLGLPGWFVVYFLWGPSVSLQGRSQGNGRTKRNSGLQPLEQVA